MKTIVDTTNIYVDGKKVYPDVPIVDLQDLEYEVTKLTVQDQVAKAVKEFINQNKMFYGETTINSLGFRTSDLIAFPDINLLDIPPRGSLLQAFNFHDLSSLMEIHTVIPIREIGGTDLWIQNGFHSNFELQGTLTFEYQIDEEHGAHSYDLTTRNYFYSCKKLEHIVNFDLSQLHKNANLNDDKNQVHFNPIQVNPAELCNECENLKTVDIKFPKFYYCYGSSFRNCRSLTNQNEIVIDLSETPTWMNEDNDDNWSRDEKRCDLSNVFANNVNATKFPVINNINEKIFFFNGAFNGYGAESGVIAQEDFHFSYASGANLQESFRDCFILKNLYIDTTNEPDSNNDDWWKFINFHEIGCSQIGTDNDNQPIYQWDGRGNWWSKTDVNRSIWLDSLKVHFKSQELKAKFLAKFETDTTSAKYGALDRMFVVE